VDNRAAGVLALDKFVADSGRAQLARLNIFNPGCFDGPVMAAIGRGSWNLKTALIRRTQ
jgi:hypothetical protein